MNLAILRTNDNGTHNGHAPWQLVEAILARSVATTWPEAKLEWGLERIFYEDDPPGTCLCGHFPICEHCVLANHKNGNRAVVGNVCVTRFMGIDADAIFRCLRRVAANPEKALSGDAAVYFFQRGWLTEWEYHFLLNTARKRRLTARQRDKRVEINERVLACVAASGREVAHAES
jgi:hypothetical protein